MSVNSGLEDECSKRLQKVRLSEVCATASSIPRKLKWASTPIIFDQDDHPASIPRPGSYPLVVDPVISNMRLSKVLMDGGSNLNVLYLDTSEAMGIPQAAPRDFHGFQGVQVKDVETAAPVHQQLGQALVADDRVNDEGIAPRSRDACRMVVLIKNNGRGRPLQPSRNGTCGSTYLMESDFL